MPRRRGRGGVMAPLGMNCARGGSPWSECGIYAVYLMLFLLSSGVVYDVVVGPPSVGMVRDNETGFRRTVAFLPKRLNAQYIIEGLTAGTMITLTGLGFVLLQKATNPKTSEFTRPLYLALGGTLVTACFGLSFVFLEIKVP
ncbi:hypothetical protein AAMO2058_001166500 [Amorphochlora amoebiformis]